MLFPYETDVCAAVIDPTAIKNLKKLNGKNVELEIKNDKLSFHKTIKSPKARSLEHVDVPELEYCDRVLSSKECTPNLVGMKAVNLRKLEEMYQEGKIDAIVPKFLVLPPGYLKDFEYDFYHKDSYDFDVVRALQEKYIEGGKMDELVQTLKEIGLEGDKIACRFAFNVQDIPGCYSGCAFPSDKISFDSENIFFYMRDRMIFPSLVRSPYMQKAKYDIPKEKYQPCIILQNYVDCDYQLFIKTDYGDNKVKIDLYPKTKHAPTLSYNFFRWENGESYTFIYDKETGAISCERIKLNEDNYVVYDESENVLESSSVNDELSNNKELIKQLKRIAKNAIEVEKEYGEPQCIDAGIKDDDIYFFQTRDIVR